MKYNNFDSDNPNFPYNLSEREKKANDYQLAKELMDYYDITYKINDDRVSRLQENYMLHSGRWPELERMDPSFSFQAGGENIILGGGQLKHFPLIDSVSKSIVADILLNPTIPIIKDFSAKANKLRNEQLVGMVKSFLKDRYVTPKINQLYQQYLAENGVQDQYAMSPDDQEQIYADVEKRALEQVPQAIMQAMEEFRTPDEKILYAFFKDASRVQNVQGKMATAAENAVIAAEVYFRLGILHQNPYMEVLNPKWVTWGGSENTEYCEDGLFAKYEQYLTPQDIIAKYGAILKKKDLDKIRDLFSPIPGTYSRQRNTDQIEFDIVDEVAANPYYQNMNIRNKEGQDDYINLLRNLQSCHRDGYGIRECYITHRWTKRFKVVDRVVNGVKKEYIVADHYEKNPSRGDLKVRNIVAPNIWHGVKLGVTDEDYLFIESVPGQYNNFHNPFKVDLTIFGGKFNTFSNNVPNASHIDLGKPWQYKYNLLMKKWEEADATDIGRILIGNLESKPDGWTISEWFMSMAVGKFLVTKSAYEGKSQAGQTDIIRGEDLGQGARLNEIINRLEYIERKCYSSMYYNPTKMGQISQYSTNENAQANMSASDRQMYRFHNKFRDIKTRVLNAFLRYTYIAYENNDLKKDALLDEYCKAYLEINNGEFNPMDISFSIVDDFKENERLEAIRQLALSFVQNGMTGSEVSAIMNADSMSEVEDILKKYENRMSRAAEENRNHEVLMEQERQKTLKMIEEKRQEFELLKLERENEVKLKLAEINSQLMANANDIDENNINDSLQKALYDLDNQYKMHKEKLDFEYFKLDKLNAEASKQGSLDRAHESSKVEKELKTRKEVEQIKSKSRKPSK